MGILGIISLLNITVAELPGAISTIEQLVSLGKKFFSSVNGRDPTPEEVAALRAQLDADIVEALKPLPPAQPGDPDYTG